MIFMVHIQQKHNQENDFSEFINAMDTYSSNLILLKFIHIFKFISNIIKATRFNLSKKIRKNIHLFVLTFVE